MTDQQTVAPAPLVEEVNTRLAKNYDPRPRMTKIKSNWYLEVRHRVAWFRSEYPAGKIETAIHHVSGQSAVVTATVTALDANGHHHGTGSGIGSCTVDEFDAYIEKAETKAIGRALASLGYGTQFSLEYDDATASGGNMSGLADTPVSPAPQQQQPPRQNQPVPFPARQGSQPAPNQQPQHNGGGGDIRFGDGVTGPQQNAIRKIAGELGMDAAALNALAVEAARYPLDQLNKTGASRLMDALIARKNGGGGTAGRHGADEQAAQGYNPNMDDVPF